MCGIVGYIAQNDGAFENARRGFLRYALMLDTLRGADSTGVITLRNKFTVKNFKSITSGYRFATSEGFKDKVPNGWATIGHNRSATIGGVSLDNAHPFQFGPISMVHNGTLRHDGANFKTYDRSFEVDSMQIAYAMSKVPVKKAKEVLEQIDGDFCVVWTDTRDKSINMARNNTRPMHLAFNYARTLLFFMSDGDHLTCLLKGFANTSASCGTIYKLDSMQHLKWKKGNIRPIGVTEFDPFIVPVPQRQTPKDWSAPIGMVPSKPENIHQHTTTPTPIRSSLALEDHGERLRKSGGPTSGPVENAVRSSASLLTVSSKGGSTRQINRLAFSANGKNLEGVPKSTTKGMLAALEGYLEVSPSDSLQFEPEDAYHLGGNHGMQQVIGTVNLVGWKNTPWSGTINFVPDALWDQYSDRDWLIRPIGLTRNRTGDGIPGMLCDLIHCNWLQYEKMQEAEREVGPNKHTTALDEADKRVFDPAGRLVSIDSLAKLYEHGCIGCQDQMFIEDKLMHVLVNDNRDLLCENCQWDQQWPVQQRLPSVTYVTRAGTLIL